MACVLCVHGRPQHQWLPEAGPGVVMTSQCWASAAVIALGLCGDMTTSGPGDDPCRYTAPVPEVEWTSSLGALGVHESGVVDRNGSPLDHGQRISKANGRRSHQVRPRTAGFSCPATRFTGGSPCTTLRQAVYPHSQSDGTGVIAMALFKSRSVDPTRAGVVPYGGQKSGGGHDHRGNRGEDRTPAQKEGDKKRRKS